MACNFPSCLQNQQQTVDQFTATSSFFSFIILFQKQFFCTQQFTDVWWPTTAIRQNDINLLILDSTLIILYWK